MAKKATAKKKGSPKKPPVTTVTPTVAKPAVVVTISSAGVVFPQVVIVKIGQDVVWVAQNNGGPWIITFKTSPFSQSTYKVPKGGSVSTTGGAKGPVGIYPYTVSNEKGQSTDEGGEVVVA
jgi:hypothetical protein